MIQCVEYTADDIITLEQMVNYFLHDNACINIINTHIITMGSKYSAVIFYEKG